MKKILLTGLCLLLSNAGAYLIYTTNSFNESGFCKKYFCNFEKMEVIAPETMGLKEYTYTLKSGGEVVVTRLNNNSIISALIRNVPLNVMADFSAAVSPSMLGRTSIKQCLNWAVKQGGHYDLVNLWDKARVFKVTCEAEKGGTWLMVSSDFEPR